MLNSTMKSIAVTDLRQRTAEVLDELHASEEPYVILQRSQKAAYLVDADQYDAQMAELRAARRQLFLREVREAEAEYAAGKGHEYADVEALLADLRG
ncbi:MAG: Antitoxin Phd YefM, type toxin-antitoxin system [Chloroflexota bacterium]|jgi:prevent-host-death family protein|nr:Antitoxin Phd YefM, type toxin-antitoxin system [Chloroflexota bacterium]